MSWEKVQEFKMALDQARKITKGIKYDDTVGEILVQIEMLAEKFPGIDMRDLNWKMDDVREAKNALESAVYGLEEPFIEAMRNAEYEYEEEEDEDMRESAENDLFKMLSKNFEREFGAPMSDPNAKKRIKEPKKDERKKEVKESKSSILEGIASQSGKSKCPECGGPAYAEEIIAEKKDACYHKVKSRYKVWPSAYASGALVKCRKVGASNWGNKSKKK